MSLQFNNDIYSKASRLGLLCGRHDAACMYTWIRQMQPPSSGTISRLQRGAGTMAPQFVVAGSPCCSLRLAARNAAIRGACK